MLASGWPGSQYPHSDGSKGKRNMFFSTSSQGNDKLYQLPEEQKAKFCKIYRTRSHDTYECFEVFKMAKMWCNQKDMSITLRTQKPPCPKKM